MALTIVEQQLGACETALESAKNIMAKQRQDLGIAARAEIELRKENRFLRDWIIRVLHVSSADIDDALGKGL